MAHLPFRRGLRAPSTGSGVSGAHDPAWCGWGVWIFQALLLRNKWSLNTNTRCERRRHNRLGRCVGVSMITSVGVCFHCSCMRGMRCKNFFCAIMTRKRVCVRLSIAATYYKRVSNWHVKARRFGRRVLLSLGRRKRERLQGWMRCWRKKNKTLDNRVGQNSELASFSSWVWIWIKLASCHRMLELEWQEFMLLKIML